ncbi:hypothetical protein TEA_018878 [Camellia sinensis var. sinensis]|uniref:tRNA (guanine(9)-N(1))-methyltransferase n=1 Tax=Camellia sinensis var. sinensis TaxID=542762 RepID=A0A4S4E7L0_CAMSN|nr:hypothetical protein TEA_018878 [Camellia sinensis var. sinensis]
MLHAAKEIGLRRRILFFSSRTFKLEELSVDSVGHCSLSNVERGQGLCRAVVLVGFEICWIVTKLRMASPELDHLRYLGFLSGGRRSLAVWVRGEAGGGSFVQIVVIVGVRREQVFIPLSVYGDGWKGLALVLEGFKMGDGWVKRFASLKGKIAMVKEAPLEASPGKVVSDEDFAKPCSEVGWFRLLDRSCMTGLGFDSRLIEGYDPCRRRENWRGVWGGLRLISDRLTQRSKQQFTPLNILELVEQASVKSHRLICSATGVNGRCTAPGHLWLTGCQGEMEIQLKRLPGFDKWIIEKENRSYIEAFQDRKEHLVYLTADSENILDELDLTKIYIVGGLVDRNRWKGITMEKAKEQGIRTAKLPIGDYLKMSSSQVLTVNQVIEILLKFLETRDWKTSFFQVIPQRKRCEADSEECKGDSDPEENEDQLERKRKFVESPPHC